ncbi:MAG: cation:proton antiporter, partial [Myxococcales bacterium]|nr:cation:proton antiporter [Myxococcales bacterium]
MRQIAVLAFLLAIMWGIANLQEGSVIAGGGDPLTLAAIGFVLLASFTVADIGARMTLPKVTGYIVAGIALGPFAADILSTTVVEDMKMFKNLALGLIATSAGLELDARGMARMWRSLAATTGIKLLLLPILVGGTFFGLQSAFHFLPGVESSAEILGLSIVFSALAVGTSPAISLAVLSETRAKGRLSNLVLGIAVLKDVVVVISLAIAIAIAHSMLAPDASLDAEVFVHVGQELGRSILAGAVLAGLLYLYIRFVGAEMLLFVAAMILVVAELAESLHLELLLVFIVAGFVIRNFTKYEHDLLHPLEVVALPVFVVFFTNAGASVNLTTTWSILPFAIALCVARVIAFYVAGRVGSAAGGDPPVVGRVAWMAYLPQAGVTLGLVGLAAERLPALAEPISNAGMAVVALNLLVGPITLRIALRKAGEIPEASAAETEPEGEVAASSTASASMARDEVAEVEVLPPPPRAHLESPELEAQVVAIEAAIRGRVELLVEDELAPWVARYKEGVASFFSAADERERALGDMLRWAARPAGVDLDERVAALRELFDDLRATCSELPVDLPIPAEARFVRGQPEDALFQRLRKLSVRIFYMVLRPGKAQTRVVPLRMATRATIEPRVAEALRAALGQWCRSEAEVLVQLRQHGLGVQSADEAAANAERLLDGWQAGSAGVSDRAPDFGLGGLPHLQENTGSRELPSRKNR